MGANLDKNERSFFIIDNPGWSSGAVATGTPNYVRDFVFYPTIDAARKDSHKYTWLVCPHLSDPELVYRYYLSSGLITIVLGKCFCESCLDKILSKEDLSESIGSSRPMTDNSFQEDFIIPLIDSNYNFIKLSEGRSSLDDASKTWITCPHTATRESLKASYSAGGQLFLFEGFFTCQDCFEKIPTASIVDLLYEGKSVTDDYFQNKIINSLYDINYESLNAVGHFSYCNQPQA
jgi:hypothetical protein